MELRNNSEVSEWKTFKTLSIDGQKKSLHEWRAYAQQQLQEGYGISHIEDILEFVVEWSNRKEWIEARTSGSTGRPKNFKIQKEQIVASARRTLNFLSLKKGNSALLCIPNRFIGGKMMIARSIIGDLDLYIADNEAIPSLPNGVKMDFAAVVPYQMHAILNDAEAKESWKKVGKIIIGGGQVDPRLEAEIVNWKNEIYESFGLTETISHIALRKISGVKKKEPFLALEGITFSVDERDCLIIHSELLPTNPLITNDIVELVSDTSFVWQGRADNMVNSGGVKIIPETLEKILKPHMNTKFFFGGLPDEKLGEKLVIVVESQPLAEIDQEDLLSEMKKEFHKYEIPREFCFLDEFVETENGKINRKKTLKKIEKA